MADFHDHFSAVASDYARFRPTYPQILFRELAELAGDRELAWDVATGSGQAALALAQHFERVIATDPSAAQLADASRSERVEYRQERAEQSSLADGTVSLICIAQALHWLDFARFFAEVARVSKPDGIFAAVTYEHSRVQGPQGERIDGVIQRLYSTLLDPYWPKERRHVEQAYRTVPFPFPRISLGPYLMTAEWSADDYLGYLSTWSADKRYREANGSSAVESIAEVLRQLWGDPLQPRSVHWRLSVLCGRVNAQS